jgi:hypothetical protein
MRSFELGICEMRQAGQRHGAGWPLLFTHIAVDNPWLTKKLTVPSGLICTGTLHNWNVEAAPFGAGFAAPLVPRIIAFAARTLLWTSCVCAAGAFVDVGPETILTVATFNLRFDGLPPGDVRTPTRARSRASLETDERRTVPKAPHFNAQEFSHLRRQPPEKLRAFQAGESRR